VLKGLFGADVPISQRVMVERLEGKITALHELLETFMLQPFGSLQHFEQTLHDLYIRPRRAAQFHCLLHTPLVDEEHRVLGQETVLGCERCENRDPRRVDVGLPDTLCPAPGVLAKKPNFERYAARNIRIATKCIELHAEIVVLRSNLFEALHKKAERSGIDRAVQRNVWPKQKVADCWLPGLAVSSWERAVVLSSHSPT
jgi:hypothetical protein